MIKQYLYYTLKKKKNLLQLNFSKLDQKVCHGQKGDLQMPLQWHSSNLKCYLGILKLLGASVNIKWTVILFLKRTEKCQCDLSLNLNFKNNYVSLNPYENVY